eukprot:symbB.v1.2.005972.t1/scaffold344.1/size224651/14
MGGHSTAWDEHQVDQFLDSLELPPLAPEPEPPKPPVEEEEEVPAEGDGGDGDPATDDAAVVEAPAEAEADPVSADVEASADAPADGEGEGGEGEVKEPVAPVPEAPKPNCWANVLPRRMVILSMEKDELGEWRLQTLKKKQEEKDRIRRELEEAGEEVPEEEEEEPEELQQLPEDEEEQQALFDKMAGDQLRTMAPYVPLKSLEPPKRLPAENPESNLEPETIDRQALKQGEIKAVEAMRRSCPLPLLSLQMDGRPPEMAAELLEVFTGPCGHRVPLPVQLEGGGEAKELLRLNLEPAQASRLWSPWRLHCPVSLYEKQLTPGVEEFAVDYAGYVFLFASEEKLQRFRQWPKRFLTEMPCINAPGLTLGFVLLSPASFRANALSHSLRDVYGFNIINVLDLLQRALKQPPMPEEVPEEGTVPIPVETEPYLLATEYQDLRQGKTVSTSTFLRLIAKELGIEKNLALIQKQAEALEEVKKLLEEAQAAGNDPPEGITLDDEGQPVVNLEEPLATPTKGYVLQGFPESAEQLEALKQRLGLVPDQVLLLKPMGEEAPETLEILQKHGLEDQPLQPILETQLASFEGLSAVEGLKISEVALETSEEEQFVQIRKHIDPFYEVVEAENMAAEIPDPEEWTPPEEDPEDGAEPEERPVISWGTCGPYCPVTLKEQRWLYPGQKDFQHVYRNVVFAVGNEKASEAFVREPVAYVEAEPVLPPPRILVTGPTGSGVAKQCEMLGQVYKIPVLKLEEIWRQKVEKRLTLVKEARKAAMKKEALEQSMLEDDKPLFPEGWMPPEEVPDDGEELQEEAPPEPEEDGLDDEQREELFVMAMKDTLGPHCGACILDGTWFGDLNDEEMAEEIKTARSLQNLLVKAQRLPDFTLVLKCKNDFAAKNTFDFDTIDREYEARLADYKAQVAAAEAKEEDPPEPPEGLVVDETEEKESDRVKARFLETKATQQQALKDMMEVFQASRAPLQKVPSDRGDVPTHKAIRCLCRPFVEQRGSLLLRHQLTKVSPYKAKDQLQRGLLQSSSFGNASPTVLDAPNFPNQTPGVRLQNRIYYPQSESELTQFMQDPALYLKNPGTSGLGVIFSCLKKDHYFPDRQRSKLSASAMERQSSQQLDLPDPWSPKSPKNPPAELSAARMTAITMERQVSGLSQLPNLPALKQPLKIDLLRAEFRQIGYIRLAEQKFAARVFFEFMFKDAALKEELLIDMNVEQASWNPHHGSPPPARWYAQHISWLNALEPPHVLWNKIIKSGNDLRFSIEVHGEFVVRFECYDFPIDIQSLSVLLEFQLADEGISPVEISTEHTQDVDVNRQNFAWSNEYELGLSMSVGIAKRRALSTRTYPHVVFSAWVLRNPFYFLVNVALPNLLFAAMAGLQFFVDVNLVADRASISLTLLLVCASYFQFSSSLVPRLGYLTILDKHSLWCIFLVIIMVFWVGIIKMVRYHTELVDFIAATCFAIIWLLSHIWFLTRLWRSRLRSRHRLERPSSVDSHLKSVQCRKNSGIFYPVSPRPSVDDTDDSPKVVETAWQ